MPMTPTDINAAVEGGTPETDALFVKQNAEDWNRGRRTIAFMDLARSLESRLRVAERALLERPALPDGGLEAATKLLLLYAELRHAPREEFNHDEHRERLRKLGWNGKEATSRFIESLRREAIKVGRAALQKQGEQP
jgi:hypothetical protein